MSMVLVLKKLIMNFISFMYLNEEVQGETEREPEILAADVIVSAVHIIVCVTVCLIIFTLSLCI